MGEAISKFSGTIDEQMPCGENLQYDPAFIELEKLLKGKPEQQIGNTITEAEPPNWTQVKQQAEDLLGRTLDLRILLWYTQALVALSGFEGLVTGLHLLKDALENQWDGIHPQLDPEDDDDPTERINILLGLTDPETFLKPLHRLALLHSRSFGAFSFYDILIATGKAQPRPVDRELDTTTLKAAVQESEPKQLQQTYQLLEAGLAQLQALEQLLNHYLGMAAPSFKPLSNFLTEAGQFLQSECRFEAALIDTQPEADSDEFELQAMNSVRQSGAPEPVAGTIRNQKDVLKTLDSICTYYRQQEPSSPVPLLLERAMTLVGKTFLDALKDLAPSGIDEAYLAVGKRYVDQDDS